MTTEGHFLLYCPSYNSKEFSSLKGLGTPDGAQLLNALTATRQ